MVTRTAPIKDIHCESPFSTEPRATLTISWPCAPLPEKASVIKNTITSSACVEFGGNARDTSTGGKTRNKMQSSWQHGCLRLFHQSSVQYQPSPGHVDFLHHAKIKNYVKVRLEVSGHQVQKMVTGLLISTTSGRRRSLIQRPHVAASQMRQATLTNITVSK